MNGNNDFNLAFESESFDFKKEISYYLFFWPWFLFTLVFTIVASFVYLRYTPNIYSSSAQIQITESDASSSAFLTSEVSSLFGGRVNVKNDISVITSNHILSKVVRRLDLQTNIFEVGRVMNKLKFGKEIPFDIHFKDSINSQQWTLSFFDDTTTISNGVINYELNKNEPIDNDNFTLTINESKISNNKIFLINRSSFNNATGKLMKELSANAPSDRGEIIDLLISGPNKIRNETILNTLIDVLIDDRIIDQRQLSKASIEFIEKRLESLTNTINSISKKTIDFQLENDIFDSELQTSTTLSRIFDENKKALNIQIQLEIATSLSDQLKSQENFEILPANIGIVDLTVNELLASYNTLVMERNNLLVSANENSPIVVQINDQLDKLRKANLKGISRYIENLEMSLSNYKKINDENKILIAGLPEKGYTMRALAREFKFAEDLLLFLSQRKEEASINYVSVLPNLKVLSHGISQVNPIAPAKEATYLAAITIGILFPFGIFFLLKTLDTKINTRDDLEAGLKGITILGEMPLVDETKEKNEDGRGLIAESARVLRSGLSFQLQTDKTNVICVTSTIKGEGKSFVSYNLAQSYSALGKKVIIVGADLRNPQLHKFLGQKRENIGLTTYLSNETFNDIASLITKAAKDGGLDFLLTGAIPPNPSELLMRSRFKKLLEELKQSYDVILIDTAPLLLVSDTTAVLPLCDSVVYVTRSQYSEKKTFPFILNMQQRENLPPFGMVLNGMRAGAATGTNYGYKYRYSYGYGYSYNYGYGYGYGSDSEGN